MAGGEGSRAGGELPKQFHRLLGIPMLWWSVLAFHKEDPETQISIVMHPGFFDEYDEILKEQIAQSSGSDSDWMEKIRLVSGGRNRSHSVSNGILSLPDSADSLIAVHDAARPMASVDLIRRGWKCAEQNKSAVPAVRVYDSLRELPASGSEITDCRDSVAVDRSRFAAVQTPQIFRADILKAAYRLEDRPEFTDDASRVEALGVPVCLYEGFPENIKVTNPIDFAIAETLLKDK